jgi:hypothetical protein
MDSPNGTLRRKGCVLQAYQISYITADDDDKVIIFTYLAELAKAVQQALLKERVTVLPMVDLEKELDDEKKSKKGFGSLFKGTPIAATGCQPTLSLQLTWLYKLYSIIANFLGHGGC